MENTEVKERSKNSRNSQGLFSNLEYKRKEDGKIDWRAMVPKEFLVVNKGNFEKRGQPIPESIEGLNDADLLITLPGIKHLMKTRGYTELLFPTVVSSPEHATVVCQIKWIPCEDNDYQNDVSSGIGDATPHNTTNFAKYYLGPIAENRAMTRCVRNYLGINVLGAEEIGQVKEENNNSSSNGDKPTQELEKLMKQKKVSWELIKTKLCQENVPGADTFTDIASLPKNVMFNMIERLQKKKVAK